MGRYVQAELATVLLSKGLAVAWAVLRDLVAVHKVMAHYYCG